MSGGEHGTRVRLDHLSEEQVAVVDRMVTGTLIRRAQEIRLMDEIPEVAALARLAHWLRAREIVVPDPAAREIVVGLAGKVDEMNEWEAVGEHYQEALVEHDAFQAFLACFEEPGRPDGRGGEPTGR